MKNTSIGIIGGGIVGQATARAYLEHVKEVRVYDIQKERTTHTLREVVGEHGCDLTFVCLPEKVLDEFFGFSGYSYQTQSSMCESNLVLKSTVPIGTTHRLSKEHCLPNLVHSPEFLTARCANTDAQLPTRNIIGIPGPDSRPRTQYEHMPIYKLYRDRWPHVPTLRMTSDESEAVKLFQNSFFAVKVAFWNECRTLADKLGLDWNMIINAILADGRICPSHTQVPGPDGSFGYGGACLSPGTPISTPSGWTPIEEIQVGDWVVDHRNTATRVTGVSSRNVDYLVSIRSRGRRILGSPDHIHLVSTGEHQQLEEKLLADITPQDWVLVPYAPLLEINKIVSLPPAIPYAKSWPNTITWSNDLAWAVGLWLADGCRGVYGTSGGRKGWTVAWSLGEAKTKQADNLLRVLSSIDLETDKKWNESEGTYGLSKTWRVRIRKAWFYYFLEEIGVCSGAHNKRAPILNETLSQSLIGGWLDGDGSYTDGTISGHSESINMITDIDRMLISLGICGQISNDGKKIKISNRDNVKRVCSWTTRHVFDESRYVRKFSYASPTLRSHEKGWLTKVQDVATVGGGEVIAIETESGYYIANGQATHNCLPKDIKQLIQCFKDANVDMEAMVCEAANRRNEWDRKREVL